MFLENKTCCKKFTNVVQLLVVSLCPNLSKIIPVEFTAIQLETFKLSMLSQSSATVLKTDSHSGLSETPGAATGVSKVSSEFAEV